MSRSPLDLDDLVEHWTLLPDELDLVVRRHEPTDSLPFVGSASSMKSAPNARKAISCVAWTGGTISTAAQRPSM